MCAECEETFDSAYTACEECAVGARRCVDTTETLLCKDKATLDNPACTTVADTNVLLFEKNHALKCGDFTNEQGDRCVANEQACLQMDAEGAACRICHNATLVGDACDENDEWTAFSTNSGAVACGGDAFIESGACVSCAERYARGAGRATMSGAGTVARSASLRTGCVVWETSAPRRT